MSVKLVYNDNLLAEQRALMHMIIGNDLGVRLLERALIRTNTVYKTMKSSTLTIGDNSSHLICQSNTHILLALMF